MSLKVIKQKTVFCTWIKFQSVDVFSLIPIHICFPTAEVLMYDDKFT